MKQLLTLALSCTCFVFFNPTFASVPDAKISMEAGRQIEISKNGYCIIQSVAGKPSVAVVFYFNTKNVLIRREFRHINNVDTEKMSVMRSMKKSLREAVAFEKGT